MAWTYQLSVLAKAIGAPQPCEEAAFSAIATDTRTLKPGDVFFALKGENFDGDDYVEQAFAKRAAAAVTTRPHSGGICLITPDPLRALQDFAAFHRNRYAIPVLALTGSCGKTSTKDLIAAVLGQCHRVVKTQGNLNNEIGCPLSLLQIDASTDFAVIEMGANHPGEIARLCEIAAPTESAITLVAPAHLEGFETIENVAKAKGEIAAGLGPDGVFYVNADDPWCTRIAEGFSGAKVYFGRQGDVALRNCSFDENGLMRLSIEPAGELSLPLLSRAHAHNVLLAVAVGVRHGISDFQEALSAACGELTRCRLIQVGPLRIIDDCYNANPTSMKAALDALAEHAGSGKRFAALGEMLELGAASGDLHCEVGVAAAQAGVTRLFARGPHAENMAASARSAGVPCATAEDDHAAIAQAIADAASPGDILLVKGSRGMRMEKVIEALKALYA